MLKHFYSTLPALALSLLLAVPSQNAFSATYTWSGGLTDDMSNALNWTPNTVPGNADTGAFVTAVGPVPTTARLPFALMTPGTFSITGTTTYIIDVTGEGAQLDFQLPGAISNASGRSQTVKIRDGAKLSFIAGSTPVSNANVEHNLDGGTVTFNGNYTDGSYTSLTIFNTGSNASVINLTGSSNVLINELISDTGGTINLNSSTLTINNPGDDNLIDGTILGTSSSVFSITGTNYTLKITNANNNYGSNLIGAAATLRGYTDSIPGSVTIAATGTLDLEQLAGTTGTFAGQISGGGNIKINNDGATGTVILGNAANSYTGTTTVSNGTLKVKDLTGIGSGELIVKSPATLIFDQTTYGTLNNVLSGSGKVEKRGKETLKYNIDESTFTGTTEVYKGKLHITNNLGGKVIVRDVGILKGNGKVLGDVHVAEFGGINPGDSTIDTLRVGGVYKQSGHSTYYVEGQVLPGNTGLLTSLIQVDKEAHLITGLEDLLALSVNKKGISNEGIFAENIGTIVNLNLSGNGQLPIGQSLTSTILHADDGVYGFFDFATGNYPLLTPILSYGPNDVYLTLVNTLSVLPVTFNEEQVATQLQLISNPTATEESILVGITSLPEGDAQKVLDQLTGEQYTSTLFAAELSNRAFMRRLFNPIRLIINSPYREKSPCCCPNPLEFDVWCDASGHQALLRTGKNFHEVEINGYEFSIGSQISLFDHFTLGAAYSYGKDFTEYDVGGHAKTMINLGGIYALYRPSCYYVLADFVFGRSHNHIKRNIDIGGDLYSPRSNVKVFQTGYYVEAGKDFLWRYVLAQPFVGLEGGYYKFDEFEEYGGSPLALKVDKKKVTPAYTRFGFHLTTRNRPAWWSFGVDLAWLYRLTSYGTKVDEQFQDFGVPFYIEGLHLSRNSFEAAANFTVQFCGNWEVFGEVTTQTWTNSMTYSFLGGLSSSW